MVNNHKINASFTSFSPSAFLFFSSKAFLRFMRSLARSSIADKKNGGQNNSFLVIIPYILISEFGHERTQY